MTDDETVVRSFVTDDEDLVDTWTITGVGSGSSRVPPAIGSGEVLAVTDRRVLWFDGELEELPLTGEQSVDHTDYTHTTSPPIVRGAWMLFGLGLVVAIGLTLFGGLPLTQAALPVVAGLAVVVAAILVARLRGETGEEIPLQRVLVDVEGVADDDVATTATIWGQDESVESLVDALEPGDAELEEDTEDDADEGEAGEEEADASEADSAAGAVDDHGEGSGDAAPTADDADRE